MKRICKFCSNIRASERSGVFTKFACNIDNKGVRKTQKCNSFKRLKSFVYDGYPTVIENVAPVVNAGADDAITLPTVTYQLDSTVSDDWGTPTYLWTYASAGSGVATFSDAAIADPVVTIDIADTYTFTLTVSDGTNESADVIVLTVNADAVPVNTMPSNDEITMTNPDDEVYQVSGVSCADAGETPTFAWTYDSVGAGVATFTDNTVLNPEVTFDIADTYTLTLTSTDAASNEDVDSFEVVVSDKAAAVADAGPNASVTMTNPDDEVYQLAGSATNPGDEAVYLWTYSSDGAGVATFADDSDPLTTVTFDIADEYTLTLSVDDQVNAADTDDVIITVSDKVAPTVHAGESQLVELPADATVLATVTDGGDEATYLWEYTSVGAGVATFTAATAIGTDISFDIADVYTITCTVDDQVNAAVSDDLTIVVDDEI